MSTRVHFIDDEAPERHQVRIHFRQTATLEAITPAVAAQYLTCNLLNRRLRPSVVSNYADDMSENNWIENGEPIQFDWYGNLIDGQHRLSAIVQSGKTLNLWVMRGMDPDAQKRIDSGVNRTFADQLSMRGVINPLDVSSLARRIHLYLHQAERVDFNKGSVSHAKRELILARFPYLPELVHEVEVDTKRISIPLSVKSFTFWLLAGEQTEEFPWGVRIDAVREFFHLWVTGANLEADNPILILRDRIVREKELYGKYEFQGRAFWLAVMAWNHWRSGRTVKKLQLPPKLSAGVFPTLR